MFILYKLSRHGKYVALRYVILCRHCTCTFVLSCWSEIWYSILNCCFGVMKDQFHAAIFSFSLYQSPCCTVTHIPSASIQCHLLPLSSPEVKTDLDNAAPKHTLKWDNIASNYTKITQPTPKNVLVSVGPQLHDDTDVPEVARHQSLSSTRQEIKRVMSVGELGYLRCVLHRWSSVFSR